jgi:hypothetical protein
MKSEEQALRTQFKQETESIKIPVYLQSKIRKEIERSGVSKISPRRTRTYLTLATAAALFMLFASGYKSPTMADVLSRVPVVGGIYENISVDFGLKEAQEKGITQGFKQSITDKNIEMAITDVYYDGTNFSIGYQLTQIGSEKWKDDSVKMNIKMDPKGVDLGQWQFANQMKKISENKYEGLLLVDADHFEEEFILAVDIKEIAGQKGKWNFTIPVTSEFLQGSIHTFTPNLKAEGLGADIVIKEITFAPSGTRLVAETLSEKGTGNNYGFNIEGAGLSGGASGDFGEQHGKDGMDHIIHRFNLSPLKEVPKEVTVVMYDLYDSSKKIELTVPLIKRD